MGGICNPASKKKTDFQKLRGGNHILNIEVIRRYPSSTLVSKESMTISTFMSSSELMFTPPNARTHKQVDLCGPCPDYLGTRRANAFSKP
jgi:hypothetical protein